MLQMEQKNKKTYKNAYITFSTLTLETAVTCVFHFENVFPTHFLQYHPKFQDETRSQTQSQAFHPLIHCHHPLSLQQQDH